MRLFFLILLLANVALFGYMRYAESRSESDAQIALLQINPEKLKLVKREPGAARADKPAAARPSLVCLEWGSFTGEEVARAAAALAKLDLGDRLTQRDGGADGYWVYIPPLRTRTDADKKAGELRALGVTDFYIVQDNDAWRFAISLGIFKTEEAANAALAQLRQKGVRSAVVGPRGGASRFVIRDPGDVIAGRIAALNAEFPGAVLNAAPCLDAPRVTKAP